MKNIIILLFIGLSLPSIAKPLTENQKIDKLIEYTRNLKDATFIRNGSEYTAVQAADHLQLKRKNAGSDIKTARQFIKDLASVSSMTGKAYIIKFKDGKTYKFGDFLSQYLDMLEKQG
jgi:hypothetical protein